MTELRVGYFLEDIAHERFFVAMVERVAGEFDCLILHDVRNARGGHAIEEYKQFIGDLSKGYLMPQWDVLLVAIDANSERWNRRRDAIIRIAQNSSAPVPCLVAAVPSPYIQAWFLLDAAALSKAFGVPVSIEWVRKGRKVNFKDTFNRTARNALGFPAQYEVYGDDIAHHMDLGIQTNAKHLAGPHSSFVAFINNLRECLARLCPQRN